MASVIESGIDSDNILDPPDPSPANLAERSSVPPNPFRPNSNVSLDTTVRAKRTLQPTASLDLSPGYGT